MAIEAAERAAVVFKALADPIRLRLYSRIAACGEACVCDIQDVGVSQPTVSHHLRKLRGAGLIDCERRGTWVYYRPIPGALTRVLPEQVAENLLATPLPAGVSQQKSATSGFGHDRN